MTLERPLTFQVEDDRLLGILHEPETPPKTGVLVVVGGPQYRIGAHRQFVHLARFLAERGIAVLRFDYRGIGDSEGPFAGFEHIEADIDSALAAFREAVPNLDAIVLWGLCDAASAIVMKTDYPDIVRGFVTLNPWVRTEAGEARTYIRHYYLRRLLSPDFWKKVAKGRLHAGQSFKDMSANVARARSVQPEALPERVTAGMRQAPCPMLLILSGNDLVAREFEDRAMKDVASQETQGRLTVERLPASDHTFSRAAWKARVAETSFRWIQGITG